MNLRFLGATPRVIMSALAKQKMDILVDIVNTEVGWLGLVERTSTFTFKVLDIFVLKQEVNGGTTEIDKGDWSDLYTNMFNAGIISMENQDDKGLYLWGHSHHNIPATPSGQDNKQINDFLGKSNPPYFIRVIANKRGECKVDVYMADDGLAIEDVGYEIELPDDPTLKAFLVNEVATKVRLLTYYKGKRGKHDQEYTPPNGFPGAHDFSGRGRAEWDDWEDHWKSIAKEAGGTLYPPSNSRTTHHESAQERMEREADALAGETLAPNSLDTPDTGEIAADSKSAEIGLVSRERKDAK